VNVSIISYLGSGQELKHMEKEKIELPWTTFLYQRDGLAAGAFTGAAEV
jgi:hypothetical protein